MQGSKHVTAFALVAWSYIVRVFKREKLATQIAAVSAVWIQMRTLGGIATQPLKQLWRKDRTHFKNQRSRRSDLVVPARTIVAFESIVSVSVPTCHARRNVRVETAGIWNHPSTLTKHPQDKRPTVEINWLSKHSTNYRALTCPYQQGTCTLWLLPIDHFNQKNVNRSAFASNFLDHESSRAQTALRVEEQTNKNTKYKPRQETIHNTSTSNIK